MAVVSGIILNKLKIPTIIGYILTGVLTAYIFGFRLENTQDLNHIAELGIVFLMFMIGLDFSFKTISEMKKQVLLYGGLQIGISIIVFYVACYYFLGFNFSTSIIVASAMSLSSTAIVLKYLNESNQTKTPYGRSTIGILIFQDIAVIPILLMIKLLSDEGASFTNLLITTAISASIVLVLLLLPGRFMAKIFLKSSANMQTDEIFVGTVFLIVLGAAYVSQYFGFSLTLGAFVAGMIMANTPYKYQVASVLTYFRDILLGIFFITVGMQVDVSFLVTYFIPIIILVVLMMGAKTLVIYLFLNFFEGEKIGARTALSLAQIGEFSFAIFLLASQYEILNLNLTGGILKEIFGAEFFRNITPNEIYQFLTIMVIFSMITTPFILDQLDHATESVLKYLTIPFIKRKIKKEPTPNQESTPQISEHTKDVIVCGYGSIGEKVLHYFKGCDVDCVAIDSNYSKVEHGISQNNKIIYGDITNKTFLREIEIEKYGTIIITIPSRSAILQLCQNILSLSHHAKIIVYTNQSTLEHELKNMGLYGVINGGNETARIIGELALQSINESNETESKA